MHKKLVGSAVVGAVVLGVVVVQVLPSGGDTPPPAAPAPTGIQVGHLQVYRSPDAADGRGWDFEIPVPDWPATQDGERATRTDPTGRLVLTTDRIPLAQEDPVSGLGALERTTGHEPGYHLTSVAEHAAVGACDAAEWDYTYQRDGVARQVSLVGVGIGDTMVTIAYDAPAADFAANRSVLDRALEVSDAG
ncbi:MAG TPA: hypothetical protein VGL47_38770 [Amycolatopsis sp.]|uniref:Uncharacterized protein n=1 Tax=Amycolatopsis nalaikhensis TaxID=715472 RepID=A0ABY8XXS8_9PSEU|nr:hypothetical protein [Amycolatopsis sp. 2-2]WIV60456.1 hypothetical protein QP939_18525 [Amycolatopsis sp. 2-2]